MKDDHGQGGVYHGILGGHVHIGADVVDVIEDLPPADFIAAAEIEQQDKDDDPLHTGQRIPPRQSGGGGKGGQKEEIEPKAWLQQVGKALFTQRRPLLSQVRS